MKKITTFNTGLFAALLTVAFGLSACNKGANIEEEPMNEQEEVVMSAEPADNNTSTIVADDLDDVDAQLEDVADSEVINEASIVSDSDSASGEAEAEINETEANNSNAQQ